MVRILHVGIPKNKLSEKRITTISNLTSSEKYLGEISVSFFPGCDVNMKVSPKSNFQTNILIIVRVNDCHYHDFMSQLEKEGFGVRYGTIDTYKVDSTKPSVVSKKSRKFKNLIVSKDYSNKLPVEALRENVMDASRISFDFFLFTSVASIIAACGLATNNSVIIVASMIISPLMGPLFGIIFGCVTRDWKMVIIATLTEIFGFFCAYLIGIISGLCFTPFVNAQCDVGESYNLLCWPNFQMIDRGEWVSMIFGTFISFGSGIGASLAFTGGVIGTLVGVAISASLLPPVVCSGMMLIYGILGNVLSIYDGFKDKAQRLYIFQISGVSLLLFIQNILMIILTGFVVLCMKKVSPRKKPKIKGMDEENGLSNLYFEKSTTFPDFSVFNNRQPKTPRGVNKRHHGSDVINKRNKVKFENWQNEMSEDDSGVVSEEELSTFKIDVGEHVEGSIKFCSENTANTSYNLGLTKINKEDVTKTNKDEDGDEINKDEINEDEDENGDKKEKEED